MSEDSEIPANQQQATAVRSTGALRIIRILLRWFLRLVLVLFLLAILTSIVEPFVFEVPIRLVLGWLIFLSKTVPQVQLNAGAIASAVVCLAAAMWGLHCFAGWITKLRASPMVWKGRLTLAVTALGLLLFSSAIAGIGIVHQLGWLRQVKWVNDWNWLAQHRMVLPAQKLAMGVKSWADENGGAFPPNLNTVMKTFEKEVPLEVLAPHRGGETPEPWIYLGGGLTSDAPGWLPVVVAPRATGKKKTRLVIDKNVESWWLTELQYRELIDRWRLHLRSHPSK